MGGGTCNTTSTHSTHPEASSVHSNDFGQSLAVDKMELIEVTRRTVHSVCQGRSHDNDVDEDGLTMMSFEAAITDALVMLDELILTAEAKELSMAMEHLPT